VHVTSIWRASIGLSAYCVHLITCFCSLRISTPPECIRLCIGATSNFGPDLVRIWLSYLCLRDENSGYSSIHTRGQHNDRNDRIIYLSPGRIRNKDVFMMIPVSGLVSVIVLADGRVRIIFEPGLHQKQRRLMIIPVSDFVSVIV